MEVMMYISGLSGSASQNGYKHWTYMPGAQFSFPQPMRGSAEFTVEARHDAITNVFYRRLMSGVAFRYARMHWLDEGHAAVLKVRFDRVFVSSYTTGGADSGSLPGVYVGFIADRWQYEK